MMLLAWAAVALGLGWPAAAAAQERPATLPLRDVDVTYRSEQGGLAMEQRSRFSVAAQRMRVDAPTPGVYTIMDYRTHVMAFVSDADKAAMEAATPAPPAGYERRGQEKVAGIDCTEWELRDSANQAALTCFTADGVMLRIRRGVQVLAIATRVAYGAIDPALFTVPADYRRLPRRR